MVLYILRHGIAEPRTPGRKEADRALTDDGRDKLRRVLKQARRSEVKPAVMISSPYVRARQTADIAAEILGYQAEIIETEALLPHAPVEDTWGVVRRFQGQAEILVAGHEPHLSHFIAYVLEAPSLKLDLKKGALVRIQVDRRAKTPHGILEWILTPKLVR